MQKTVGTKWTLERGERELPRAELFRVGYFVKTLGYICIVQSLRHSWCKFIVTNW